MSLNLDKTEEIKDAIDVQTSYIEAIEQHLNNAQRNLSDNNLSPFAIKAKDNIPVEIKNNVPIAVSTVANNNIYGPFKGFDSQLNTWYQTLTVDYQGNKVYDYYNGNVNNTGQPLGFTLGNPGGPSLLYSGNFKLSNQPISFDDANNIIDGYSLNARFKKIIISSTSITEDAFVSFKTAKQSIIQTIILPAERITNQSFLVAEGDYITDIRVLSETGGGGSGDVTIYLEGFEIVPTNILLNLKVFLHGPYNISFGYMNSTLATESYIPADTINIYSDNTLYPSVQHKSLNNINSVLFNGLSVVDWIVVMLHSDYDFDSPVVSTTAILLTDGTVVDINGEPLVFFGVAPGNYYITVRHRNHLAVVSTQKILFEEGNTTTYDFSTSSTQADGYIPQKEVTPGVFAMWAGDVNQDFTIDVSDQNLIPTSGSGYLLGDINMNGLSNSLDVNLCNQGINAGTTCEWINHI